MPAQDIPLAEDREGQAAVLHCLAAVNASRQGLEGLRIPWDGADRSLPFLAMTEVAVAALAELERLGGDPGEFLSRIYSYVTDGQQAEPRG
jgi:hypothetical protein